MKKYLKVKWVEGYEVIEVESAKKTSCKKFGNIVQKI